MADAAQDLGLARAWNSAAGVMRNAGELEITMALAIILPLGALMLGFSRGRKTRQEEEEEPEGRGRAMSFASGIMTMGAWPPDLKQPPPLITALLYFDDAPDQAALEETCAKILKYDNFRSLPKRSPTRWFPLIFPLRCEWEEIVDEVQPADVISRVQVAGSVELMCEIERTKDSPLRDFTHDGRRLPLWGMHVIENTDSAQDKEGIGSVIMFSVHHAIGDGMSLVAVSRRVAESLGGGEVGQVGAGVGAALDAASRTRRNLGSWMKFSFAEIVRGIYEVAALAHSGSDTPLPFGHYEGPSAGGGALAGFPQDENGVEQKIKRGSYSGRRKTVMFPDIPLSLMKKMKDAAGVTVNDVVIALVSGCIRRYCLAQGAGDIIGGKVFKSRALFPVALPRTMNADDASNILCNKWAFVSISLYMDEADPVARLAMIKATNSAVKRSPIPMLRYLMQKYILPLLPLNVCREMVYDSLATHTVTVSNVPGPQEPVAFAKKQLKRVHMVFNNAMPQVGVVSLDGMISTNFTIDPVSIPDWAKLPSFFLAELTTLAARLGVDGRVELAEAERRSAQLTAIMAAAYSAQP